MIVTVRFLFWLILLLQFGTKHLVVRHLRNYHGMLSVPANDPKKLSGRETDPDSYSSRTLSLYRGSTVPKIDVNVIKWNAENSRTVEQFWLCSLKPNTTRRRTRLIYNIHKKGRIFVALTNLKE